ncbi:glycosyltransferase family 2 protein [Paenibacillus albidus]|nr:glycosyltransferase family 2 protein [Paenibacillus albidus]
MDNGSTDGTLNYLHHQPDLIVIENSKNMGFAKGCNQGYELSRGDYIMFLNNDTVVSENWLTHMLRALNQDERIGMVGPVTNYSSGHQRITVPYVDIKDMDDFARQHCKEYSGIYSEVRRLVGFCMLTKRSVLEEVGLFDEIYGLGNYEDDDLCLRLIRHGYGLRVVVDSFIHHVGHATTKSLPNATLAKLLRENAATATKKWGEDIHKLIYNPAVTVAACLVVHNAEETIRWTLESLTDDLEEIIVVDLGSTDGTLDIVRSFPVQLTSLNDKSNKVQAAYYSFENSKSEYVLWLYQGDVLSAKDIRVLRAAKISTEGHPDMIKLEFNNGLNRNKKLSPITQRFVMNREMAARKLATTLYGISIERSELF